MYVEYICEDEFKFIPETLRIINDAGRKVNKIQVKGLDTVRSNFAVAMKDLLSKVLEDILANVPKEQIE